MAEKCMLTVNFCDQISQPFFHIWAFTNLFWAFTDVLFIYMWALTYFFLIRARIWALNRLQIKLK